MIEQEDLVRIYSTAARIIEKNGKVSGRFYGDGYGEATAYCAVGVLGKVTHGDPCSTDKDPILPLAKKLGVDDTSDSMDDFWGPIFDWSDCNSTETVVNTLREIAEELRGRQRG